VLACHQRIVLARVAPSPKSPLPPDYAPVTKGGSRNGHICCVATASHQHPPDPRHVVGAHRKSASCRVLQLERQRKWMSERTSSAHDFSQLEVHERRCAWGEAAEGGSMTNSPELRDGFLQSGIMASAPCWIGCRRHFYFREAEMMYPPYTLSIETAPTASGAGEHQYRTRAALHAR